MGKIIFNNIYTLIGNKSLFNPVKYVILQQHNQ